MNGLHLVRLPLNMRTLTAWALHRRYLDTPPAAGARPRDAELGYALHAALTGFFGEQAPRPFAMPPLGHRERRNTRTAPDTVTTTDLLGYARAPLKTLRTLAGLAEDDLQPIVDWERARSRPLPDRWPAKLQLRFELRSCPVRRVSKPFTTTGTKTIPPTTFREGLEVDAYQIAVARALEEHQAPPPRGRVYIEWLEKRLAGRPGEPPAVRLLTESVQVEAFRSARLLRRPANRNGQRSPHWLTKPDVRFTGLLDVADPTGFGKMLARGVGRHCGFGFGMLLIRPA